MLLDELATPAVKKQSVENQIESPGQVPVQSSLQTKATPGISDPLTRAKEQKENGLEALLTDQLPVIEERVVLPRELKFFGKPNVYYEFRLDASHDLKKPHLVSRGEKSKQPVVDKNAMQQGSHLPKNNQKQVAVYWEGEAGLFVSSQNLYQETTESN